MRADAGYAAVVGTGGVGTGVVYRLVGDHDLGRDESRLARLGPERDACKLHIILHYVAVVGRGLGWRGVVRPISAVGDDAAGRVVVAAMRDAGMDCGQARVERGARTLHSVCWQYPDGSGGNLTEAASACAALSAAGVRRAAAAAWPARGRALALAVPEVPLAARAALVASARARGATVFGSFASGELADRGAVGQLAELDVVALNRDEARMLAGARRGERVAAIAARCAERLAAVNPRVVVAITDGAAGAYGCAGGVVRFVPALRIDAVNTAGAGDAFLAGLMIATLIGLRVVGDGGATGLHLATALAAFSTRSRDTINTAIDAKALRRFARANGLRALAEALHA